MVAINYDWDELEDNIDEEYDDSGATIAEYTTEPELYGNLISQSQGGVTSQYHFDALGSTLALTDESQQVTDTYAYAAFGELLEHVGNMPASFRYLGQKGAYCDHTTGDYVARKQLLSPPLGRRLSLMAVPDDATGAYAYSSRELLGLVSSTAYGRDGKSEVIPAPGKCKWSFECVRLLFSSFYHCGLYLKYFKDGKVHRHYLHSRGHYTKKHGCLIQDFATSPFGGTALYDGGEVPMSVCACILATAKTFNTYLGANAVDYTKVPHDDPCAKFPPVCNSNYAVKCLLTNCNIATDPTNHVGGFVTGWDHRMWRCKEVASSEELGKGSGVFKCCCDNWELLDGTWCGGAAGAQCPPRCGISGITW